MATANGDVPEAPTGLHIYTSATPSGYRATILLAELGLPYTLQTVDVSKGEHLQESYAEIHPSQLTPALVDHEEGGLRVFESGAVLQYVCDCKCPPGSAAAATAAQLLPPASEPRRRGPVLAWLSWMTSTYYAAARRFFAPLVRGAPATPETTRYAAQALRGQLEVLEAQLKSTGAYVAGDAYSLADIACLPYVLGTAVSLGIDTKEEMPALYGWIQRLLERPAVRKGLYTPAPWPGLQPGAEAEEGVRGMRKHLVGMGLEDLPVEAPRIVVPPPEDD
ncbi:hypothetical protein COHA_005400 [Chlorella ohadii]|uniref:Glutathione S-transferase n=1 Tax=Chlorella ohadii TaxID=2649997 RepID=A0AAD5DRX9_9CHLO|nr:hypothetical protein COHA_005400 [Chlorella ohadii]